MNLLGSPFGAFWVAFLVNAALAYPVYRLLLRLNSRQTIDPHAPEGHQVKQGTPTMGGLMILGGLALVLALQTEFNALTPLLLIVAFGAIGFVDDYVVPKMMAGKRGLGWKQKLILEIVLAAVCLGVGTGFSGDPTWWALGVFFVLFFANAYNFADGLDALSGSLLIALGIGFIGVGALLQVGPILFTGWVLIGATIPFLFVNAPPAKAFMGDVGSLPIGAVIGYLNLLALQAAQPLGQIPVVFGALFALNFVLIVELVLVPIQVGYYKKTKKRIFPATPIHHGFEKMGFKETRIVWWFFLTQILLAILATTILEFALREVKI